MNMKKSITISLLTVMLFACGNKTESKESSLQDAEGTNEVAQEVEEAPAAVELVTPDLILCEVQGNVKQIDDENYPATTFDESGNLIRHQSNDNISNVKRNDKGQLTDFLGTDWMTVEWEADRPSVIKHQWNEMTIIQKLTYDENGRISTIDQEYIDEMVGESERDKITYTYANEDIDSHGNWTKRTVKFGSEAPYVQTRKIQYYE